MTINDQITDEKLQYDINREAAKRSTLSSGKIDKYEYLTGKEILPSNQQQIIEQAKFTYSYSSLRKAFEKQIKTIAEQGQKQIKALEGLESKSKSIEWIFTEGYESAEIKNKVDEIKEYEKKCW